MDIPAIKSKLGLSTLEFSYLRDESDKTQRAIDPKTNAPTKWMRHWDDDNRLNLVVSDDVVEMMQAEPTITRLGIKDKGIVKSKKSGNEYKLMVLIAYAQPDAIF